MVFFSTKIVPAFLILVFLTSCASYFKRKDCEATNWFSYGEKVALEGRRLSGDHFVVECNKADADIDESALDRGFKSGMEKYCQPEVVYLTGKSGNFFSADMCSSSGMSLLLQKHKSGVQEYCKKSNAYSAGAEGRPYNKICPAELESGFLPDFNRGRKAYLYTVVSENEKLIASHQAEISKLQYELNYKKAELDRAKSLSKNNQKDQYDPVVGELQVQVRSLEGSINNKNSEVTTLRDKNREIKLEIVRLGN